MERRLHRLFSVNAIQSHRDLIVWQKSVALVEQIYCLTANFPETETYHLVVQTTRAAASVAANIAEGHARSSRKDYAQYLAVAKGSLMEVDTFLEIAQRLGYADPARLSASFALIEEISKMLTVLRRRLLHPPPTCNL